MSIGSERMVSIGSDLLCDRERRWKWGRKVKKGVSYERKLKRQPSILWRIPISTYHVCPVHLVDKLELVAYEHLFSKMMFNSGSSGVFRMVSMVLVLWEVAAILENRCGIQEQNYVAWFLGSKMPVGFYYSN